jgi:hypothetical protein
MLLRSNTVFPRYSAVPNLDILENASVEGTQIAEHETGSGLRCGSDRLKARQSTERDWPFTVTRKCRNRGGVDREHARWDTRRWSTQVRGS